MPTLSEYFESEAAQHLDRLRRLVASAAPDADALQRAARALRGSAQMAREDRVYRAGLALESAARAVASATLQWTDDLLASARAAVEDLRALVDRSEPDSALDGRLSGSLQRWQQAGVPLPAGALGQVGALRPPSDSMEFRAYAAKEVEGIAEALERGVFELANDPMDREALKNILRRQRALLGAARLDEIPVVAEILRAVEDLTRVIAKLDVGVKQEWLDIYRVAREGLKAAIEPLRADLDPPSTHALARLRHMRAELLERYGTGEAVSAAAGSAEGLAQARTALDPTVALARATTFSPPAPGPAPPTGERAVPIQELLYRGAAARRRADELRAPLERLAEHDPAAREALDELYDLLRQAAE